MARGMPSPYLLSRDPVLFSSSSVVRELCLWCKSISLQPGLLAGRRAHRGQPPAPSRGAVSLQTAPISRVLTAKDLCDHGHRVVTSAETYLERVTSPPLSNQLGDCGNGAWHGVEEEPPPPAGSRAGTTRPAPPGASQNRNPRSEGAARPRQPKPRGWESKPTSLSVVSASSDSCCPDSASSSSVET